MDETVRLSSYYAKRKYVYEAIGGPRSASTFRSSSHPRTGFQVSREGRSVTCLVPLRNLHRLPSPQDEYLTSVDLASALLYCLRNNPNKLLVPLNSVGSFFDYLPARLGLNTALDDAISCLCAVYGTPVTTLGTGHSQVFRCYTQALSSLQKCIDSPRLLSEPLTLCASIVLQLCEVRLLNPLRTFQVYHCLPKLICVKFCAACYQ